MSSPKLLRILQAVASRGYAIRQADGYYTDLGSDVRLDKREPDINDLPVLLVYLGTRTAEDTQNKRAKCATTITVEGFCAPAGDAETIGIEMLADIQRAIELEDETLGGLTPQGLEFQSDEIYMPESGENVVGAMVTYTAPHIRKSGDPEIL